MVWKAKTELKFLLVRGLPSMVEHFLAVAFPGRRLVASRVDKRGAVTCLLDAGSTTLRETAAWEWPEGSMTTDRDPLVGDWRMPLCADEVATACRLAEAEASCEGSRAPQAALEVRWVHARGADAISVY